MRCPLAALWARSAQLDLKLFPQEMQVKSSCLWTTSWWWISPLLLTKRAKQIGQGIGGSNSACGAMPQNQPTRSQMKRSKRFLTKFLTWGRQKAPKSATWCHMLFAPDLFLGGLFTLKLWVPVFFALVLLQKTFPTRRRVKIGWSLGRILVRRKSWFQRYLLAKGHQGSLHRYVSPWWITSLWKNAKKKHHHTHRSTPFFRGARTKHVNCRGTKSTESMCSFQSFRNEMESSQIRLVLFFL